MLLDFPLMPPFFISFAMHIIFRLPFSLAIFAADGYYAIIIFFSPFRHTLCHTPCHCHALLMLIDIASPLMIYAMPLTPYYRHCRFRRRYRCLAASLHD